MACNFFSSPLSLRKKGYNENLFIRRCTYVILSAFVFPFYPQKKVWKAISLCWVCWLGIFAIGINFPIYIFKLRFLALCTAFLICGSTSTKKRTAKDQTCIKCYKIQDAFCLQLFVWSLLLKFAWKSGFFGKASRFLVSNLPIYTT